MLHKSATGADIHVIARWTYADAAARAAATGFVATDIYKVAVQQDNNSVWILVATTPTWAQMGGGTVITDSASLMAALSDETGGATGAKAVFSIGPTITSLKETKTAPAISAGALTLDLATANVFEVSLNANITTLTISNPAASGTAHGFTLVLVADGTARTVTWGAAVKWPGGTAPTLTSTSGKKDAFVLFTMDGGTTWLAYTAGQNQ